MNETSHHLIQAVWLLERQVDQEARLAAAHLLAMEALRLVRAVHLERCCD